MDVTFNFIGMCAADWQRAFAYFTGTLGLQAETNPAHGDWANLGGAWEGYYHDTPGLVCELFDDGKPANARSWGVNQNIRPAIHVDDLDAALAHFHGRGVVFSPVEQNAWGQCAEFVTVEGIRWAAAHVPNTPTRADLTRPHIGHVAIKTANFDAQLRFYQSHLGFTLAESKPDSAVLTQRKADHPLIVLMRGGETLSIASYSGANPERSHPFFLSLMTGDIDRTAREIDQRDVRVLRPLGEPADWGGRDMVILDADGNAIQIVQYQV